MTRKEFLGTLAKGVAVGALAVAAVACGGDDDGGGAVDAGNGKSCLDNGTNVSIGSNHSHSMTVTAAEVAAGEAKTYDIAGSAGHSHMVTITAAQFARLADNESVTVSSTSGSGHTHSVTVSCA